MGSTLSRSEVWSDERSGSSWAGRRRMKQQRWHREGNVSAGLFMCISVPRYLERDGFYFFFFRNYFSLLQGTAWNYRCLLVTKPPVAAWGTSGQTQTWATLSLILHGWIRPAGLRLMFGTGEKSGECLKGNLLWFAVTDLCWCGKRLIHLVLPLWELLFTLWN